MATLQASNNDSPRRSGTARSNFMNNNHGNGNSNMEIAVDKTYDTSEFQNNDADTPVDLNIFVGDLLEQMNVHFTEVGMSIMSRMDEMATKIDELEKSVESLLEHAGLDREGNPLTTYNATGSITGTGSNLPTLSPSTHLIAETPASLYSNHNSSSAHQRRSSVKQFEI